MGKWIVTAKNEYGKLIWTGYWPSDIMRDRRVKELFQDYGKDKDGKTLFLSWEEDEEN